MRVVVTGAAGFIGSHLTDALLARGDTVMGVDSFDPFYAREVKEQNLSSALARDTFTLVEGDIRSTEIELDAETVIVHLAAKAGVRPSLEAPTEYAAFNVEGTIRLLDLAGKAGVRRFVFGSSSSVYGDVTPAPFREDAPAVDAVSPYGATKRAGELLCRTFSHLYGMRLAALRLFTVYGPRQRPDLAIHKFTRLLSLGRPIPMYGDGAAERDYAYIADIVDGIVKAIAWTGGSQPAYEVFNLAGGEPVRLDELIALLGSELAVEPKVQQSPARLGDVLRTEADLTKASQDLGFKPTTPFATGLGHFVDWYREVYGTQS